MGTLTNGASATLTLNAQVDAGTGGSTLTNTATVTTASLPDPAPGNNSASASVTVQVPATADLALNKMVDDSTPNEWQTVIFTVTVTNNGPNTDDGIQVSDTLPAGFWLTGGSVSQGSYVGGVWNVSTLANGATATLTLNAQIWGGTSGTTLTNTATIAAASLPDPVGANNSASASVTVQVPSSSDLALTKTVNNSTPNEGDIVSFTVTVTNNGPNTNNGVQVNDIPQAGLWPTGTTVSQGSYIGGVWTVGTLTNGASATLILNAQVGAGTSGSTLTNNVIIITASEPDPNGANNNASASVIVQSVSMNPPVANDDTSLTAFGTAVTVDVLANDSDPDGNISPASVSITANPPGGVIQSINPLTGAVTYQPNIGYVGIDQFGYQVCDTTSLCDTAVARVTVAAGEVIIIDNASASGITISGAWSNGATFPQYWASDYLHDQNAGKGTKSVTFTPNLVGGTYEVYMWWPADSQNASNMIAEIHYASGVTTVGVNQRINGGQWNPLGALQFNPGTGGFVVIQTGGTDGYVIADAVRFVKVG
ncbi:MAG: DUF11 domain-containing protein [Chloroflexi bacterium]|nr:DUF11 domain-containing protein [Chloroflexota bacterium]